MRTIGIWCEHNFHVYSAIPVIEKYTRNAKVILFTRDENVSGLVDLLKYDNFQIVGIDKFIFKPAIYFKLVFEILFVPENFSFVYKNEFVNRETFRKRFLRKLFFIKISPKNINRIFLKWNNFFFKNKSINKYFNLDLMITVTKVHQSHLIPHKDFVPHINIMESWDHPMKFPYYIFPNYCLVWNKDLSIDTKKTQHLNKVRQIDPLKFRYIFKYKKWSFEKLNDGIKNTIYSDELDRIKGLNIVLYPTTTSSSGIMHKGEMKFIKSLCEIFEQTDYHLYIKPKPNAPKGDYDIFTEYENVIVGAYSNNKNGLDMLDNNYHIFRYLLLCKSNVVINVGTTFALEASLLDKKLVQLRLKSGDYFGFAEFCKTYHLNKYVLSLPGVINFEDYSKMSFLDEVNNCTHLFSESLKKWITNW